MVKRFLAIFTVIAMLGSLGLSPVFAEENLNSISTDGPAVTLENNFEAALLTPGAFSGGDGLTADTAYQISTEQDLRDMVTLINDSVTTAVYSNKYYKQINDIALSAPWGDAIGNSIANAFQGQYNGQGYSITNFVWNPAQTSITSSTYVAGLFGYVTGSAEINGVNIVIPGSGATLAFTTTSMQNFYIGTLAGNIQGAAKVADCSVTGGDFNVINNSKRAGGTTGRVGGLIGCVDTTTATVDIRDCYAEVNVSVKVTEEFAGLTGNPTGIAGGFIGVCTAASATINKCYSKGNVESDMTKLLQNGSNSASDYAGGFMGTVCGIVTDCYTTAATVTAMGSRNVYAGAFAGNNSAGYNVSGCYAAGVTVNGYKPGASSSTARSDLFIGGNETAGSIINCYYGSNEGLYNPANKFGGTEIPAGELATQYAFNGFDFTAVPVWGSKGGVNGGRPVLCGVGEGKAASALASISGVAAAKSIVIGAPQSIVTTLALKDAAGDNWINNKVTWSSSDESTATVDSNGLVTAAALGTASITAAAKDKSSVIRTCVVHVTATSTPGIEVSPVQNGTLTAGMAGTAAFAVATANIADAAPLTVTYCSDSSGTAGSQPVGVTITAAGVSGDASTVIVTASASSAAGTYYFKLTGGGATSNVAAVTVSTGTPAITVLTTQIGKLTEGTAGTVTFALMTTNVSSVPLHAIYCDNAGNDIGVPPNGITITANASTVTVTTTVLAVAGSYSFKIAGAGVTSNLAAVVVDAAPRINIGAAQSKTLVCGTPDTAVMDVIAANIADGTPLAAVYCSDSQGTAGSQPVGVTITAADVTNNASKVYATITAGAAAGTYYFKLTGGGATSNNVGTVIVNEPTIAIARQNGNITERTTGSANYEVTTSYIPNAAALNAVYCDDAAGTVTGNTAPAGVTISVSSISNNAVLVTVTTTADTRAGTYFFKLTGGNAISNVAVLNIISRGVSSDVAALVSALGENAAYVSETNAVVLTQSATMEDNGTVPDGIALTIPDHMTLTIPQGKCLTVSETARPLVLEGAGSQVFVYGILDAFKSDISIADGAAVKVYNTGEMSRNGKNVVGLSAVPAIFTLDAGATLDVAYTTSDHVYHYVIFGPVIQNVDYAIEGGSNEVLDLKDAALTIASGVTLTLKSTPAATMDRTSKIIIPAGGKLDASGLSSVSAALGAVIKSESNGGLVIGGAEQPAGTLGSDGAEHWWPVPGAPANLTASDVTQTSVTLSWAAPAGSVTDYEIYMNGEKVQSDVTATSKNLTGLSAFTSYKFEVAAKNNGVYSEFAVLTVRTKSASGFPGSGGSGRSSGNKVGLNLPPASPQPASKPDSQPFADVPSTHWGYPSITALYDLGVVNGSGDGNFYPEDKVSRAEFIKMLFAAFGVQTAADGQTAFTDVNPAEWYAPWIKAAVDNGLVTGYSNGTFGVNDPITREDAATMIYRVAQKSGYVQAIEPLTFADGNNISDYAKEPVGCMKATGIVNGYPEGTFLPKNNVTRAESAKMLEKTFEVYGLK